MREGEGEAAARAPTVTRSAIKGIQSIVSATSAEQERIADRIFNGLVHRHNPTKAHLFDFVVAELGSDETSYLCVRFDKPTLFPFGSDVLRQTFAVCFPHLSWKDSDIVLDATRRNKLI